ncbi:MAG: Ig-like domain-containing protein, partial [Clostridia bacterium]|nr:Ig-like domain-containing protein [Clostridia bacterium]
CLIHVGVPAEGVDLDKGRIKLSTGDSYTLTAEFDPSDTTNTKCFWFTDNKKIAEIDQSGKITAKGKGKTTVYVITDDGNYYSSCKVEVNK